MVEPLQYRKVYDKQGAMTHVELVQGDQVIQISLAAEGTHYHGGRWLEVREVVDHMQQQAHKEALDTANMYKIEEATDG